MTSESDANPVALIQEKILVLRGEKVMLDKDLAELYTVETRALNQAVKRNIKRFPVNFMFQLSKEEMEQLSRSQIVILKRGQNIKYLPYVFTEHGALMLSAVLKSEVAIKVSIQVIEAFTKLRQMLASNEDLRKKLLAMEHKYDSNFKVVFEAVKQLLEDPINQSGKLGYRYAGKKK